jgi:hypothetical protein
VPPLAPGFLAAYGLGVEVGARPVSGGRIHKFTSCSTPPPGPPPRSTAAEFHRILLAKALADIEIAERLLTEAAVSFEPLEARQLTDREDFHRHLAGLKRLLVERDLHVVRRDGELVCGPLSPWRETERVLGISEAGRKQKVGILRLPPHLLDDVRQLPAEHAIVISRLPDPVRQEELVRRAPELSQRQVKTAVERLRENPELDVAEALREEPRFAAAGDPLDAGVQIDALADLCRQLTRRLGYLSSRLIRSEREQVCVLLADLRRVMVAFEEAR